MIFLSKTDRIFCEDETIGHCWVRTCYNFICRASDLWDLKSRIMSIQARELLRPALAFIKADEKVFVVVLLLCALTVTGGFSYFT